MFLVNFLGAEAGEPTYLIAYIKSSGGQPKAVLLYAPMARLVGESIASETKKNSGPKNAPPAHQLYLAPRDTCPADDAGLLLQVKVH